MTDEKFKEEVLFNLIAIRKFVAAEVLSSVPKKSIGKLVFEVHDSSKKEAQKFNSTTAEP